MYEIKFKICFKRKFKIRTQPILLTFVQQIMWALPWSSCRNGMAVSSILEELLLADDYQGGIWSNGLCKLKLIDSVNTWDLNLLFKYIYQCDILIWWIILTGTHQQCFCQRRCNGKTFHWTIEHQRRQIWTMKFCKIYLSRCYTSCIY